MPSCERCNYQTEYLSSWKKHLYSQTHKFNMYEQPTDSNMKPDVEILKNFSEGTTLSKQYANADWTRKTYICKHLDKLKKMIANHEKIGSN